MSTIFGKIIRKEIPAKIVYEDNEVLAFEDIQPQAPIHILVIPKKEIPTLNDLTGEDAELMGKLFLVAQKIAKEQGFAEKGYRTVFNCNGDGGQTVDHIHLHLLAGRSLTWPPG
ncbi:histidine triad nucleotide-binding protein [Ignatzschineria cameli]|uniref:Histidine triad nucleotide-binding protein n=1 Tax=Ignatzschineria cameli TaxID=2182793 RepID=A0A2U2AKU4_9GAMM|nr:histidine triad nucleotide-binding protein [Ignatzschineria cameli]PWD83676.1 histidine triad nucleotide-binding protein [Ignatzschineria cameli]PWD88715.1 histidine triad nucleotide-binding protein [Ignatzschineria cameli]PWD89669.1 histidine triad nucleotide-binding protein [Ignatzschineria cameli]PWD90559.1 histidine triad nucleotide-binding protein [Ignatzschineria cameli]